MSQRQKRLTQPFSWREYKYRVSIRRFDWFGSIGSELPFCMHSRIVPWCQTFCFVQNMAGSSRRLRTQAWCLALLAIAPMLCRGFLHAAPHRGLSTRLDRRASCFFRLYAGIDPKKRRRNRPSDDDDDNEDMRGGGGEDEDDLEYERVRPEIRRVRPPLRRGEYFFR